MTGPHRPLPIVAQFHAGESSVTTGAGVGAGVVSAVTTGVTGGPSVTGAAGGPSVAGPSVVIVGRRRAVSSSASAGRGIGAAKAVMRRAVVGRHGHGRGPVAYGHGRHHDAYGQHRGRGA